MSGLLAQKAEELAEDKLIMKSYKDFYEGKGYFLTKNTSLFGAKRRPPIFPESSKNFSQKWTNSEWFVHSQRTYLLLLAGLSNFVSISDLHYSKLKDAYAK